MFVAAEEIDYDDPKYDSWEYMQNGPALEAQAQWDTLRYGKLLAPFIGTYLKGGHDAIVLVINGHLTLYYTVGGKDPSGSFDIPLRLIGKKETSSYYGSKGHTTVEKEYFIEGHLATQIITSYGRNWKTIEHEILRVEGQHLINERTRRHYRRKYFFAGGWVEDRGNTNHRRTLDYKSTLLKLSPIPISFEKFVEMADSRPYTYVTVSGEVSAANLRTKLENGEYNLIAEHELVPQSEAASSQEGDSDVVNLSDHRRHLKPCDRHFRPSESNNVLQFVPKGKR